MFSDEPFERFGAHAFLTVLLQEVRHLLQIFGMLLEVLVDLVLFLWGEARGTSRTRLVIQADQPCALPALNPLRHGIARNLIDVGNAAQSKALMAQQQPMGTHASTSGRMKAMHVGQG